MVVIIVRVMMTKLECKACDEYDPPNCKCMCHEIIKYYEESK